VQVMTLKALEAKSYVKSGVLHRDRNRSYTSNFAMLNLAQLCAGAIFCIVITILFLAMYVQ
jgi:hypothetical protein